MKRPWMALLLVGALAAPAAADELGLMIGDPVPTVDIEKFFQGQAIDSFDKEKVYVLEFWATW